MTAPTHMAFGILWAALAGTGYINVCACALGALLPDIDHPQSSAGRILFFISQPINNRFGHRGLIHGFVIWIPLLIAATFSGLEIIQWIALGGLSHILIDMYNTSGVKAGEPFTSKVFVCFKSDWRINTSSVQEILVFIAIFTALSLTQYSHTLGGPRKLINMVTKSPKITVEEYNRAGLKRCTAKGSFRWADGRIQEVEWLVVGIEGSNLVYWDGEKLIKPTKGQFLRSILKQGEQDWPVVLVNGFCTVQTPSFWYDGRAWQTALPGDLVFGSIKTMSGDAPAIKVKSDDDLL